MKDKLITLKNRINQLFLNMGSKEAASILARVKGLSARRGVSMFTDDGLPKIIDIQLRPWPKKQT